jgi:hypothetical protein
VNLFFSFISAIDGFKEIIPNLGGTSLSKKTKPRWFFIMKKITEI